MLEENGLRTSAIIAAYNEEKTLSEVLGALTASRLVDEVIVVSDGSTDGTVDIARGFEGVTTIALRENCGKGYAMRAADSRGRFRSGKSTPIRRARPALELTGMKYHSAAMPMS